MRICIGSDHAGYELKTAVKSHLLALGHEVEDLGTYEPQVSVDYPDYGRRVAQQVAAGAGERGIVICGTGIGVSIAANKVHGIRAALCTDSYMARMARLHNDANVLALGGRVVGVGLALDIVDA
ncbi:MAG TPA: ribose 5-phosphate isomerase B, partial [Anaerolineae bacterium]|nr:ribose 5-phosphate isomerase B [Anaerolineae bacterium]